MIARALPALLARYDSIVVIFHAIFSHATNEKVKLDCTNNNTKLQSGHLVVISHSSRLRRYWTEEWGGVVEVGVKY